LSSFRHFEPFRRFGHNTVDPRYTPEDKMVALRTPLLLLQQMDQMAISLFFLNDNKLFFARVESKTFYNFCCKLFFKFMGIVGISKASSLIINYTTLNQSFKINCNLKITK